MGDLFIEFIKKWIRELFLLLPKEVAFALAAEQLPAKSKACFNFYNTKEKKMVPLALSRINYLEAGRNMWMAHLTSAVPGEGEYVLHGSLALYPALWQQGCLLRVHKAFVINLMHFLRYSTYCHIYMYGEKELPVGRLFWPVLREQRPAA